MTRVDTVKLFAVIAALYPREAAFAKADAVMVEAWTAMLTDMPFELAQGAVQAHSSISQWPPSVSEILQQAVKITKPTLGRTADEAWRIALKTIRHAGWWQPDLAKHITPSDVWEIMASMGYRDMCASDKLDVVRGQFIKLWEAHIKRAIEQACLPPSVKTLASKLRLEEIEA